MIPHDFDFGYGDDLTLEGTTDTEYWEHPEWLPKLLDRADDWRTELP
jgi:hypothetical protein